MCLLPVVPGPHRASGPVQPGDGHGATDVKPRALAMADAEVCCWAQYHRCDRARDVVAESRRPPTRMTGRASASTVARRTRLPLPGQRTDEIPQCGGHLSRPAKRAFVLRGPWARRRVRPNGTRSVAFSTRAAPWPLWSPAPSGDHAITGSGPSPYRPRSRYRRRSSSRTSIHRDAIVRPAHLATERTSRLAGIQDDRPRFLGCTGRPTPRSPWARWRTDGLMARLLALSRQNPSRH